MHNPKANRRSSEMLYSQWFVFVQVIGLFIAVPNKPVQQQTYESIYDFTIKKCFPWLTLISPNL